MIFEGPSGWLWGRNSLIEESRSSYILSGSRLHPRALTTTIITNPRNALGTKTGSTRCLYHIGCSIVIGDISSQPPAGVSLQPYGQCQPLRHCRVLRLVLRRLGAGKQGFDRYVCGADSGTRDRERRLKLKDKRRKP
jgi:hypothetical protein